MTCGHCGTWNDEDDHRCHRCGRRLHRENARPALEVYPVQTATAPAIYRIPEASGFKAEATVEAPLTTARRRTAVQPSLFAHREISQVIPFDSVSPSRSERKRPPAAPAAKGANKTKEPTRQQSLELVNAGQTRMPRSSPEAVIYCDARVASPAHRLLAFAVDLSLVLIAVGMLLSIYHFAGGTFPQSKLTMPIFAAMGALVYFLYEALWGVACGDTPGMRTVHLRVLDFDGREPDLRQRMFRLGGSMLSVLAAGLGLMWALTDEESLTWHDHMSNTFPTYVEPTRG